MKELTIRTLNADEVECRMNTYNDAKKSGTFLLYKDARVDQRILDEVVGPYRWQRSHELINGNLYCTVSILDDETGVWVSKQDVGTESNTEKEKGQASDAFKRACFNWGIGRELYTAPDIRISNVNKYTRLDVAYIGYDDKRRINALLLTERQYDGSMVERFRYGNVPMGATPDNAPQTRQNVPLEALPQKPIKTPYIGGKTASTSPQTQQQGKKVVDVKDKEKVKAIAEFCFTNGASPEEVCSHYECIGDVVSEVVVLLDGMIMEKELTNA